MTCLLLFGLVASAIAAPQYYHPNNGNRFGPPPFFPDYRNMRIREDYPGQNIFDENIFDVNRFWRELSQELREIDNMLADMRNHLPVIAISQHKIEDNMYKITIPLIGFEEKDIAVKAREGLLMIQACHQYPGGSQKNYMDVRTLPKTLVMNGTWIYDKSTLKITFPLKEGVTSVETVSGVATDFTTKSPIFDREEIDEDQDIYVNENADVGLDRGDLGKDTDILTNLIPDKETVEATTYAVDLKDEVEFVPVRY